MASYIAIPLTSTALLMAFGCVLLALGARQRGNRIAGTMLLAAGYWAFCEVLWNSASDAATALVLHKLAMPGFLFIGPLGLLLMSEVTERPMRWVRDLARGYLALCAIFLVLGWTTPYMIADMQRTSWGYGLVPGPLFTVWFAVLVVAMTAGSIGFARSCWRSGSLAERIHGPVALAFIFVPFLLGAVSDAVLPILGHQLPRYGTLCFSVTGAAILWALHRYGYSLLSYRDFSRRILRTLPDGVVLTSLTGRVRVVNDEMERMLECGSGQAIGRPLADILDFSLLDPPTEVSQHAATLRAVNGSAIPVLLSSAVVADNDGSIMGLVIVVSDQREVVSLRNRVMTSDRLAAVGQLAAGIAHEINNPLAFVRSNLNLLRGQWRGLGARLAELDVEGELLDATSDWEDLLGESLEGVDRAVTIVADVKDFSHAGVGELVSADLHELLDHVIRMAGPEIGCRIRVVRDYGESAVISCLPQRLKQLFLNLIVNAAQAIEGSGHIWVTISERENTIEVRIEDDGCGVPAGSLERVFDPFFTTKPVGEGTGLGLTICHEITRSHGGVIAASARPGGGTRFSVWLPRGEHAEAG